MVVGVVCPCHRQANVSYMSYSLVKVCFLFVCTYGLLFFVLLYFQYQYLLASDPKHDFELWKLSLRLFVFLFQVHPFSSSFWDVHVRRLLLVGSLFRTSGWTLRSIVIKWWHGTDEILGRWHHIWSPGTI